jgi:hypothetical protein
MTRKSFLLSLERIGACAEAHEWCLATKGTPAQLWARCKRPEWLLWLAGHTLTDSGPIVLSACAIARTVLKHVPKGELRPLRAVEVAEAVARGEYPSASAANGAARIATDAASSAANGAASSAANAASSAANAAYSAACAAYIAAYGAANVAYSAANVAYGAANVAYSAACAANGAARSAACRLIRKNIPWRLIEAAL